MISKKEGRALIKDSDYADTAEKLLNCVVNLTYRKDFDDAGIQVAVKFAPFCRRLKTSQRQVSRVLEELRKDGTLEWQRTKGILRCRIIFNALSARAVHKESTRNRKTAETARKADRAAKARDAYAKRRRASKDLMFEIILSLIADNERRSQQSNPAMTGGNQ
jgi:hypothetical protein